METKEEILRRVADKKLSVEEALLLLSNIDNDEVEEEKQISTRDELINDINASLTEGEYALNFESIVDYMHKVDWRYAMSTSPVEIDDVKNTIRYLVPSLVDGILEQVKAKKDISYSTGTGGIELNAWVDDGDDVLQLECNFVADSAFYCTNVNTLKKINNMN